MRHNPEIHHRRSIRLKVYDYSQPGAYFLTICARQKQCLFGGVVGEEMRLNELAWIVHDEWLRTREIRREITLDEFVIMPNHIHGIIIIGNEARPRNVGAHGRAPLLLHRPPQSLGSVVAGFKCSVTKRINAIRGTLGAPVWQRNYYEHVIRGQRELERVREYIANNPCRWALDLENPTVRAGHGRTSAQ